MRPLFRFQICAVVVGVVAASQWQGRVFGQDPPPKPVPIVLDLATAAGEEIVADVPGMVTVDIRIVNRSLTSAYRFTVEQRYAGGKTWSRDMPALSPEPSLDDPARAAAPCRELVEATAALRRIRDEKSVPAAAARLRALTAPPECFPQVSGQKRTLDELDRQATSTIFGEQWPETRLVVERLEDGRPAATWKLVARLPEFAYPGGITNEQEWIATEVVRDLARLGPGTGGRALTVTPAKHDGPLPRLHVGVGSSAVDVEVARHVWDPESYVAFARLVLPAGAIQAPSAPDERSLSALLSPTTSVMQKENERISAALVKAPRDAALHEQAALLLATLALRERAGAFQDSRPALARTVAHLAMARAISGAPPRSSTGLVAESLLLIIGGRPFDGLAHLAAPLPGSPVPEAWRTALQLAATGDWRGTAGAARASLLVRLMHFRALAAHVGVDQALAFLAKTDAEAVADWGRVVVTSSWSVGAGHQFAPTAMGAEAAELAQLWKTIAARELSEASFIPVLNGDWTGAPRESFARVIPREAWSAFYRRHVLNGAAAYYTFVSYSLGDRESATKLRATLSQRLAGLHGYPLLAFKLADSKDKTQDRKALCAAAAAALATPAEVPLFLWDVPTRMCSEERDSRRIPAAAQWFSPVSPVGTAYEASRFRAMTSMAMSGRSRPTLDERALDPYSTSLAEWLVPREGSLAEMEEFLGPLAEYDGWALGLLRQKSEAEGDRSAERNALERLAALNPQSRFDLAFFLAAEGTPQEAADEFERAIKESADDVDMSNNVEWLVGYYFDRGNVSRAREVALAAANTGSANGMAILAHLLERMGDVEGALAIDKRIAERYENSSELPAFYLRQEMRRPKGPYVVQAGEAMATLFPDGLQRVTLADFVGLDSKLPPRRGFGLGDSGMTPLFRRLGLRARDVVVALDGYKVDDGEQYVVVRSFKDDLDMTLIVWRDQRYQEVRGQFPRRRFGPAPRPAP